jgi:glycosyltransferase involved in cell wall biosynthesis
MRQPLEAMGYKADELVFISNGMDLRTADSVPPQPKLYDALWMGRFHRQKGIDDLIYTLRHLAAQIPNLKVMLIGNVRREFEPLLRQHNLQQHVEFSGFVSETEKFRLLKSSRLFLMPSHYESWGIVIAEAIACGTPVLDYDIPVYRPVFAAIPTYVGCFDVARFAETAAALVARERTDREQDKRLSMRQFAERNSWDAAGRVFTESTSGLLGGVH